MKTKTVNIAIAEDLLNEVDEIARKEYRSRSDLFREALRRYVLKNEFSILAASFQEEAKTKGLKHEDVDRAVADFRKKK